MAFDYIEGYTIQSSNGRIIFPVIEPFGSHLAEKIGNAAIAEKYVYQELYDSTLTIAQQVSEKNKFIMTGEYKASSGAEIRLNAMNVPRGSVVVTCRRYDFGRKFRLYCGLCDGCRDDIEPKYNRGGNSD